VGFVLLVFCRGDNAKVNWGKHRWGKHEWGLRFNIGRGDFSRPMADHRLQSRLNAALSI